jgi:hypothetical protein
MRENYAYKALLFSSPAQKLHNARGKIKGGQQFRWAIWKWVLDSHWSKEVRMFHFVECLTSKGSREKRREI